MTLILFFTLYRSQTRSSLRQKSANTVSLNDSASNPSGNEVLTVIGFGATSQGGKSSSTLLKGTVQNVPGVTCKELYAVAGFPVDAATMICAGLTGADRYV